MDKDRTLFWKRKALSEMSTEEWELLCDGCGLCCLRKLEDQDTGEIFYTDIACHMLDIGTCRCTGYANRHRLVPECLVLTPTTVEQFIWLPDNCTYRLPARGEGLPDWHHLISGNPETIHESGMSVRNKVVSEKDVRPGEMMEHIVEWR